VAVEANASIELTVTFLNPLLPDDLVLLSTPASYLSWSVRSLDGHPHDVTLYLDAGGELAVNDRTQPVDWSRAHAPGPAGGLDLLRIGSRDQRVLERFGDNVRQDWGWFYLAVPQSEPHEAVAGNRDGRRQFALSGHLPAGDDLGAPRPPASHYPPPPALELALPLGSITPTAAVERHVLLAYDE